jgi:sulfite reductase (NADPH) flavoprotein alpha-component
MGNKAISIYFGTETGNSRYVAETLATMAAQRGCAASVRDLVNVSADELARDADPVVIVISTWNRGRPPFFARRFCAEVEAGKTPMPKLRYTVIALGEESYEKFCECGKSLDALLEKLGGTRFLARADFGSTFKDDLKKWEPRFWKSLEAL